MEGSHRLARARREIDTKKTSEPQCWPCRKVRRAAVLRRYGEVRDLFTRGERTLRLAGSAPQRGEQGRKLAGSRHAIAKP